VADAVGVELCAEALRNQVDVVVLKILCDARDERHTDRRSEERRDPAEELPGRVLREARRIVVDDVTEDERVEEGEDLVDGCQHERDQHEASVVAQVRVEQLHVTGLYPNVYTAVASRTRIRYLGSA